MRQIDFFKLQKEILEKLFPPHWFLEASKKNHPAYLRWALCEKVLEQGGKIRFPEQKTELPEIGRILLDSTILVILTEGDLQQLRFGSLDLYGDQVVQKKICSRIIDPEQFEDLMVELYVGAWHKTKSHVVRPIEMEGYPDLRIEFPDMNTPIFIECKHLWAGSRNRLQGVIKKANQQIKNATKEINSPYYGVAVLDVSTPVAAGQVENDDLSDKLREIVDIVQSALSGQKNRSVRVAILVWDDYMIMGKPPERTLIAFRRRRKRISHKNITSAIPENLPLFKGYTTTYWLHWEPREKPIKGKVLDD